MKFDPPGTLKLVRLLARVGLSPAGGRMEPSSRGVWFWCQKSLSILVGYGVGVWIFLGLAGFAAQSVQWRLLLAGLLMLLLARGLGQTLFLLGFRHPYRIILMHLPVPGRRLCEWARDEALRGSLPLAFWAILSAWLLQGLPGMDDSPAQTIGTAALIWLVSFAGASVLNHPVVMRWRLGYLALVPVGCAVALASANLIFSFSPSLLEWLRQATEMSLWLLPTVWVLPDRLPGAGGLLALAWTSFGLWWWWRRPLHFGPYLDRSVDLNGGSAVGAEAPDDQESFDAGGATIPIVLTEPQFPDAEVIRRLGETPDQGWIERLSWKLLAPADHAVAAALAPADPGWTRCWNRAARWCVILLMLAGLMRLVRPVLSEIAWEVGIPVIWGLLVVMLLWLAWPLSNRIPFGTATWPVGYVNMACYALLPVSTRDLVRIATRLTIAGCLAAVLLALPALVLMSFITGMPGDRLFALHTLPALAILWVVLRPLLVVYRLRDVTRPRRGAALGHWLIRMIGWGLIAIGGSTAIVAVIHLVILGTLPEGFERAMWFFVLGELAVIMICARLPFTLFHWRLRTNKVDLLRQG